MGSNSLRQRRENPQILKIPTVSPHSGAIPFRTARFRLFSNLQPPESRHCPPFEIFHPVETTSIPDKGDSRSRHAKLFDPSKANNLGLQLEK